MEFDILERKYELDHINCKFSKNNICINSSSVLPSLTRGHKLDPVTMKRLYILEVLSTCNTPKLATIWYLCAPCASMFPFREQ